MQTKNNKIGFDLNTIAIFTRVVERQSFTQAAAELELTKSTVSRKIAELERYLGIRLLTRSTRQLVLTAEGDTFYRSCSHILEVLEQSELEVTASHDLICGTLKIVMPVEVGKGFIGDCVKAFMMLHPNLKMHIELSNRKVDLIKEGYDVMIQIGEIEDSSLIVRTFHYSTRVLVASPQYIEQYGLPQNLADLKAPHHQIRMSSNIRTGNKNVLEGLPYRFKVNTLSAALDICLDGFGITYIPEFLCRNLIEEGRLIHILPSLYASQVPIPVSFIYPERDLMPRRLRAFIDFTISRFQDEIQRRKKDN
ncbi:LysR substrate-binding domain-containing protein [Photobacterium toruni]|uniref:LysR family transcriptional regulator n=1 Tax=Photobacterium toruni TaxID=1935446 RepID=UPI002E173467|nr:LysR substrate-binding domain-containing protein [Photobacterium toruni]